MAEIFTPATQPLSHSARVADAATQPLSHSEWLSGRVSGWVAPPATLAEWLSGFFSQSGRVAEWLTRCSSHSGWVAEWLLQPLWQRDWGGSGSLRPATEQRHLAQRRPLQGTALQTAPLYCVWVAEHGSLAPPCSSRGQVLRNKQKDNLRAKATDKDSRKLQAVRFKVREEMRPGRLSLSSSKPWLHTRIAWILHCSPQAPPLPAIMTAGTRLRAFWTATSSPRVWFLFPSSYRSCRRLPLETTSLHTHIYIYIHTRTYILYTSEAPVMYRTKLHAQSRPKGHVIHQGAGVAEWRCTGYCSFTSSSGSNVHRPSERHR